MAMFTDLIKYHLIDKDHLKKEASIQNDSRYNQMKIQAGRAVIINPHSDQIQQCVSNGSPPIHLNRGSALML